MKLQKTPIALAAFSLFSLAAEAAPSITLTSPQDGTTYSKVSSATCATSTSATSKVVFSLVSSSGQVKTVKTDSSSPFDCSFNPYHYADGNWTLRAVASDSRGATATATRSITINNNGTTTGGSDSTGGGSTANTPPALSFSKPANGSTVAAGSNLACEVSATDADGISKLEWLLDGKVVFTETSAPFNFCSINNIAAGTHVVGARATDKKGATSTAQVTVTATTTSGGGTGDNTGGTSGAPVVSFSKPANNTSVAVGGSVSCAASATDPDGIAKVEWLLDGKLINTEFGSPYDTCNVSGLTAGTHVITARATDKKGTVGQAHVTVTAGTSSGGGDTPANAAPVVSFSKPANNSTITAGQGVACAVSATDADGIAKLEWFLDGKLVNTEFGSPYDTCNIGGLMSGSHVIKARATDKKGATGEAQVTISVASSGGGDDSTGGGSDSPSTGSINPADIKTRATADMVFAQQPNIYADILGSSPWMSTVPESGKHGSTLPNGETIRFGKETDPVSSSRKALSFQLAPSDPTTGGSKRVELGFPRNIEYNKTYWIAVSVYAHDWGTLSTSDQSLFGFQLHNGTKIDLSPTIALYTARNGRYMKIQTRYSTASTPSQSNSVTQNWAEQPIPFGRWMDFVVKFRNNVQGQGFAQVWLDGNLIVNHTGNLGFNTPGYLDFMKFGYYNWTSAFSSPRKVRLRNPTLVQDPTGSKYTPSAIRSILGSGTSSAGTSDGTTTAGTGGVCSTASCVAAQ